MASENPDIRSYEQRVLPVLPVVQASQTSGATTAQTYTITPQAGGRVVIYSLEAYCNTAAATATLSIESPSGTVVYQGQTAGLGTVLWYLEPYTPRVFAVGIAVLIKITAASAGTTTLNVYAGLR